MGADSEKIFAKLDEGGDVKNGVRIEMDEFNTVISEKATEELAGWNAEPAVEKGLEDYNLFGVRRRERLTVGGTPPNDILLRQNGVADHLFQGTLRHGRGGPQILQRRGISRRHFRGFGDKLETALKAEGLRLAMARVKTGEDGAAVVASLTGITAAAQET